MNTSQIYLCDIFQKSRKSKMMEKGFYNGCHFIPIMAFRGFFDRQIADSLVYELYFKEKFHQDGLYPQPKEYLLEAVSKHLKPINHDRYAELYWKKQLEGNLTDKEEKELAGLEKKNMKTIEEVYKILKENKKVEKCLEK